MVTCGVNKNVNNRRHHRRRRCRRRRSSTLLGYLADIGGALRTFVVVLSGHYANFGTEWTVQCNGTFFRFLNVCPFFDNTAEKVHTLYFNTYLQLVFNAHCF